MNNNNFLYGKENLDNKMNEILEILIKQILLFYYFIYLM